MLRPRDDEDQKVILERLSISPEPRALSISRDGAGNWIALAQFDGAAGELCIESEVSVARWPAPVVDRESAGAELASADQGPIGDDDDAIQAWAIGFLAHRDARPGLETFASMTRTIHSGFRYRRRLEHGVQTPERTLALKSGACRDFALLLVAAARRLGLKARFVSGYVHSHDPSDASDRIGGHTHAWASVFTPEQGWVDFDPTAGTVGSANLVRVAIADDPAEAVPVSGVYFGAANDFLGMDVEVIVERTVDPTWTLGGCEPVGRQGVGVDTA